MSALRYPTDQRIEEAQDRYFGNRETDPALIGLLLAASDEWGASGVAVAAAKMTNIDALINALTKDDALTKDAPLGWVQDEEQPFLDEPPNIPPKLFEAAQRVAASRPVDMVNHPPHYNDGPLCPNCGHSIECITVTRRLGFNVGNAIKYLWRAGKKGDLKKAVEDLRKAAWYCNDEANDIEKREGLA